MSSLFQGSSRFSHVPPCSLRFSQVLLGSLRFSQVSRGSLMSPGSLFGSLNFSQRSDSTRRRRYIEEAELFNIEVNHHNLIINNILWNSVTKVIIFFSPAGTTGSGLFGSSLSWPRSHSEISVDPHEHSESAFTSTVLRCVMLGCFTDEKRCIWFVPEPVWFWWAGSVQWGEKLGLLLDLQWLPWVSVDWFERIYFPSVHKLRF